jgi:hypothetical protein
MSPGDIVVMVSVGQGGTFGAAVLRVGEEEVDMADGNEKEP